MLPDVRKLFRLLATSSAIVAFVTLLYYQYSANASAAAKQAARPTLDELLRLANNLNGEVFASNGQHGDSFYQKPVEVATHSAGGLIQIGSDDTAGSSADANEGSTGNIASSADTSGQQSSRHPIEDLTVQASVQFGTLLSKEKTGVRDAAVAYRTSRGRHPPPGWQKYIEWCMENEVMLIEDFYDPLYRDLAAFWSVSPYKMRSFPQSWHRTLSIRNGKVQLLQDGEINMAGWLPLWDDAVRSLPVEELPDVDLAFNVDDEPKLFPNYEIVNSALMAAEAERVENIGIPLREISSEFSRLPPFNEDFRSATGIHAVFSWSDRSSTTPLWDVVRDICPPLSPGRKAVTETDFTRRVDWTPMYSLPHLHKGFVQDWKEAKSACANPELRKIHGSFVAMKSHSLESPKDHEKQWDIIEELVPLLSGSKMGDINSDILVPPAIEFKNANNSNDENYDFKVEMARPWWSKENRFMWRGIASGGNHAEDNWTRFHRHRLVAILNSSLVEEHYRVRESGQPLPEIVPGGDPSLPRNFPMPSAQDIHSLAHMSATRPADAVKLWLHEMTPEAGVGFTHMLCANEENHFAVRNCWYTDATYSLLEPIAIHEQFLYKYLLDVDGFSYSDHFSSLLQSNSLPIKATIYDMWHDSRLVPWKHFVPMDNSFVDLYGILEYFVGYDVEKIEGPGADESRRRPPHDKMAETIAKQGAEWADKALRREDRLAYMYRLILEMARLSDDRRLKMGWVEDLRGSE